MYVFTRIVGILVTLLCLIGLKILVDFGCFMNEIFAFLSQNYTSCVSYYRQVPILSSHILYRGAG